MLFDTDVIIWALRGNARAAAAIDGADSLELSVVSYMELVRGTRDKRELRSTKTTLANLARSFLEQCFGEDLDAGASAENLFKNNGDNIRKLVQQRMRLLFGAWMTQVGHTRPGVAGGPDASAGMPLDEAKAKAREITITRQITALFAEKKSPAENP